MSIIKKAFVIVVIVLSIIIYNYDFEDSPADTSKSDTSSASSAESKHSENSLLYWQHRYAERNNIPLEEISGSQALADWLKTQKTNTDPAAVRAKGSLFAKEVQYLLTEPNPRDSFYLYQGELDGEYPDGYGILYKTDWVYEGFPEIIYIGEFKKGYFDGYGLLFAEPDNADVNALGLLDNYEELCYSFVNYVALEGRFKDDLAQGPCNKFEAMTAACITLYTLDPQGEFTSDNLEYTITTGKFKDGEPKGQGKVYIAGELDYEGKLEDRE